MTLWRQSATRTKIWWRRVLLDIKCLFFHSGSMLQVIYYCHAESVSAATSSESLLNAFQRKAGDKYDHHVVMGQNDEVICFWKLRRDRLYLALGVEGVGGWVGFGIADAGAMRGADIVVFEAAVAATDVENGTSLDNKNTSTGLLRDYYSMDFTMPQLDDCPSDWTLLSEEIQTSFIAFEATRLIDTHDPQDLALHNDSLPSVTPTPIIVAWGDEERLSFHGPNRSLRSTIRFFQNGKDQPLTNQEILEQSSDGALLFTAMNYSIPETETTYKLFCVDVRNNIIDFPESQEVVTLIGVSFSPSIDNNGVDTSLHVHHFQAEVSYGSCQDGGYDFRKAFYAWAPGQDPFILPDNVGIQLGGNDGGYQSLWMDIHYDNRQLIPNVVDDSGMSIHYVLQPRPMQAETMAFGRGGIFGSSSSSSTTETAVGWGSTKHVMDCPSSCLSDMIMMGSSSSVTVFAEALHMHAQGARMVSQIVRDYSIVHEAKIDVWDYPRNGVKVVQQDEYQLYPGDEHRTICYYNTSTNATSQYNSNNITPGVVFGRGSRDEMCIVFLWWYNPAATSLRRSSVSSFCGPKFPLVRCRATYNRSSLILYHNSNESNNTHDDDEIMMASRFDRVFGSSPKQCRTKGNKSIIFVHDVDDDSWSAAMSASGRIKATVSLLSLLVVILHTFYS